MNESEKNRIFEKYNKGTHVFGNLAAGITLLLLLGGPFIMGLYLGAMPNIPAFGKAFLAVGLIWLASSIVEYSSSSLFSSGVPESRMA